MDLRHYLRELKRRNIFKVAAVYVIAGWIIIQVATSVFPVLLLPEYLTRAVVIIVLIGFPLAMVFAWAFEVTPEGIQRTKEPSTDQTVSHQSSHLLNNTLLVILIIIVAILSYKLFIKVPGPALVKSQSLTSNSDTLNIPTKSIAVLPFENDSGDSTQRYFSDGLSEDLILALNQYHGLTVIGRESSFQFRGKNLDSRAIGQKLGVAHLLEGSVSHDGDEVRVRTELVDTHNGHLLWSDHYDRPYKNLFTLQDDITKAVANALKAKLLGSNGTAVMQTDRPPSGSLKAYNAYLEGNFHFNQNSEKSYKEAIKAYQQAVHDDHKYAAAFARLSLIWITYAGRFQGDTAMEQSYLNARAAADTAIKLAPNSVEAHLALGTLLLYTFNWHGAKIELKRAFSLAPSSAEVKRLLARSQATLWHLNKAVRLAQEGVTTNPLDANAYYYLARYLLGLGRAVAARQAINRAISLAPEAGVFHAFLTVVDIQNSDIPGALAAARAEPDLGWRKYAISLAYSSAGDTVRADQSLHELIAKYANNAAYQIAMIYAYRGQPGKVFAWLNRSYRQHDPGLQLITYTPILLRYKNDPRFTTFCKKVGLPPPDSTDAVSFPLNSEPKP
jgi:TolB-like protein